MPLIIPSNSISAGGYEVDNSLRFNSGSSDNLSRNTWGTATSDKKFTISVWVKRSGLGYQQIVNSYDGSTGNDNQLKFQSTDALELTVSTGTEYFLKTNRLFRDVSAWYHIVFAFDSTQGTDSNRYKLYVNGTQETSFSSISYPPQNTTYQFFRNSNANNIGSQWGGSGGFFNGYMAEFYFIDGQQLDPTSFGEFDEDSGIWKPIDVSGLTFGTNGFYLDFENSGSLGADVSGNGNNFTVNNLTSIDQTTDTPTNNFCTLNPLNSNLLNSTLSNGNLTFSGGAKQVNYAWTAGTISASKGKYYWEVRANDNAEVDHVGVSKTDLAFYSNLLNSGGLQSTTYGGKGVKFSNGYKVGDGSQSTYMGGFSVNDILNVALDLDNGNIYFGRNGQWSDGAGNANQTFANAVAAYTNLTVGDAYVAAHCMRDFGGSNPGESEYNFGSPPFTISSGNSDANSYGTFEYAVPSGYYALCTKNLATYG